MTAFQPAGSTTVAPWVVTDDTSRLLAFITQAFDGDELLRVPGADGGIGHAEIRVGDTVILAFDRRDGWPSLPSLLRVWVPEADAAIAAAIDAGATLVTAAATSAFGQHGGRVKDPFGNIWWIATQVEEVDPSTAAARLAEPESARTMTDAEETLDR